VCVLTGIRQVRNPHVLAYVAKGREGCKEGERGSEMGQLEGRQGGREEGV
jgi:hypothetical protein